MKPSPFLKVCLLAIALVGCAARDAVPPAPTPIDTAPIKEAAAKVEAAAEKVTAAQRDIDAGKAKAASKAAAAVSAAGYANQRNPDGPPKEATAGEIGEASKWLPPPTGEDAAEAMRRVNLVLTGQRDEARAAYAIADGERIKANTAAAKAETEKEAALRERDAARQEARDRITKIQSDADARVNAYRIESETRINEANANAERVIKEGNAKMIRAIFFPIAGVLAVAAFAIAALAWARDSVHLWGTAALLLGLSIVAASIPLALTASWWMWVAGVIALGLLGGIVLVVVRANRVKKTEDEKHADNAAAADVLDEITGALDKAKNIVPDAMTSVLPVLSREMSKGSKALVNAWRAERQRFEAPEKTQQDPAALTA